MSRALWILDQAADTCVRFRAWCERTLPLLRALIKRRRATTSPDIVDQGGVRNEVCAMIPVEVEHARELLSRYFRPTRLAAAESLAQRSGARVYLKIESDLPTGSFKPRGALNALLTTAGPVPGVVAASTGNHGAAVVSAHRQSALFHRHDFSDNCMQCALERCACSGRSLKCRGWSCLDELSEELDHVEPCTNHRGAGRSSFIYRCNLSRQFIG